MKENKMKYEIEKYEPCQEAIIFRSQFTTFEEAWQACERGDWMLWIASKLNIDKRLLTLAKGRCAETVIHLMKDEHSKKAVRAAIDYGNGLITDEELVADYAHATAAYAADAAAKKENKLQTANICRELLTKDVLKALEGGGE